MPFKQAFEKHFNRSMQQSGVESHAGPSSQRPQTPIDELSIDMEGSDLSPVYKEKDFEQDFEMSTKKGPAAPPRFSTIFPSAPPCKVETEPASRVIFQEAMPERIPRTNTKRGVHLSLPVFILFAAILFFESTLLFAYTIIGLYNNMPAPVAALIPGSQMNSVVGGTCRCDKDAGAAVNNNFYLGNEPRITGGFENAAAVTSPISVTALSTTSSSSSAPSSSSTSQSTQVVTATALSTSTIPADSTVTVHPTKSA